MSKWHLAPLVHFWQSVWILGLHVTTLNWNSNMNPSFAAIFRPPYSVMSRAVYAAKRPRGRFINIFARHNSKHGRWNSLTPPGPGHRNIWVAYTQWSLAHLLLDMSIIYEIQLHAMRAVLWWPNFYEIWFAGNLIEADH